MSNYSDILEAYLQLQRIKKFTDEQIEIARQLREKGYTRKMIEKATGISVATQKSRIKQLEAKNK